MKNYMQKKLIQSLRIIEIFLKKKEKYIENKLNMLPIHEQLSKLDLKNTQLDFDATPLYASAIMDNDSVYPKNRNKICF